MPARITIHDAEPPSLVGTTTQLEDTLHASANEARAGNILSAITIETENGNAMTIVVGGEQTVLSFDCGGLHPRYYTSRGGSDEDEPLLTCYLNFQHHSEFPRRSVIPFEDGINAAKQFFVSDELPSCIRWEEL